MRLAVIVLALFAASACHKPDLIIDSGPLKVDLAGTGVPGGSLRLAPWRLTNRGTGGAGSSRGAISSSYHLSPDPVVTTSDRVLPGSKSCEVDKLGPGESHDFPGDQQIAIPSDIVPGTYYFGVVVDDTDGVEESDESNNVSIVRIGLVKAPED